MTFALLLLFLSLVYIRPWEFAAALEPFRLAFVVGNAGLVAATLRFILYGPLFVARIADIYLFIGFAFYLTVSPVLAEFWLGGALQAFLFFSPVLTVAVLMFLSVDSLRKLRVLCFSVVVLSLALVGMGAYSYYTGWEAEKFVFPQKTDELDELGERIVLGRVRALGTLNDPNDLAQALLVAAPLLWPAWKRRRILYNAFVVVLPSLGLLYGILLTRSRGAIVAILVVVGMRLRDRMTRFRTLAPAAAGVCAAAGLVALGGTGGREISTDDASAGGRLMAWRAGMQMLRSNPLTGVGFGNFTDHHLGVAAHNSFVNCFAELGLAGYTLWIALLVAVHWSLSSVIQLAPADHAGREVVRWASAIRMSFYGAMATAFFLSRTYAPAIYLVVGMAVAVRIVATKLGKEPPAMPVRKLLLRAAGIASGSIVCIWIMVTAAGF